jgi:hypothetical protein
MHPYTYECLAYGHIENLRRDAAAIRPARHPSETALPRRRRFRWLRRPVDVGPFSSPMPTLTPTRES